MSRWASTSRRWVNANDPNDPDDGPNLKLNFPEFATVSQNQATGTACEGCRVEVFVADGQWFHHGQGKTFAGAALAGTDGTFSVTLDNVAFGQYLTATATDPAGNTSEFAQNTLVRDPANAPPRAADDTAATPADTPIVIDVLVNDVDLDGDPLTVVDVAAPNNGVATTNGTFVIYRPNGGFVGVDSLQYTASDNFSGISTATVTVTVEGTSGTGELGEVIVNPTELTVVRDGGPESYSVTLGSEPAAAVTITLVIEGFLQVEPREIVFDAENWDKAQTVTVSMGEADAADANTVAAIRQNTIHHLSRSADESYDRLGLPSVTVYVTDPVRGVLLPLLIR